MWNKRLSRPLLGALALSLLAHLWLIARMSGVEWPGGGDHPILVQLAPVPGPVLAPVRSDPVQNPARPQDRPPPEPEKPMLSPVPEELPVASEERAPETPVEHQAPPVFQPPEESVPEPSVAAPEDSVPPAPPESEREPVPGFVSIEFNILRKGSIVGTEHHVYDYGDTGYTLTSIAKPKGLLALALSDLEQKSEGKVTRQGLRPERFTYQYGKDPDKAQKAYFDWSAGKLLMLAGSRKQEVALTEGAQDLMSFMYQFMFVPPLQEMQLSITNGKRFKTYTYAFEGEETITTPFGKVDCLHIARSTDDGEEKTELWLAADYHYLPLKISKTEKDGTVLERVATRVQME